MTSERFPNAARVKRRAEFDAVFADPIRIGGRYFTILARSNELGTARLGLIVSRKVDRRAVGRNRVKRIVREAFRVIRTTLPDVDCAVLAKSSAGSASNAELRAEADRQWRKLRQRLS